MSVSQVSKSKKKQKKTLEDAPMSLTVTSYNSKKELLEMYNPAMDKTLKVLESNFSNCFFNIDGTKLHEKNIK